MKTDEVARNNALIRFYLHKDPIGMSDDVWCRSIEEIDYVLKYTGALVPKNG